ncbi:MAG: response regulator transcription factor [Candidatus Brocadiia bacterium]|jgi:two-component system phosphate regulon response regulator OmpR|nr:response regulator transcription factor [Candidatus Brocadiia bacterium]HJO71316.1 response regulator transcription factor [Rhodospirillales bacterium]
MSANLPHILVVDDDDRLRDLLGKFLHENGILVATACDAADARAKLASLEFDLIVLDVMMPGESGLELCKDLRRKSTVPILMLTAMGEPEDRIAGLESGVDDYLSKPFEPRELLLRVYSILRRVAKPPVAPPKIRMGDVMFDPGRDELRRHGQPVHLTSVEAALLKALAERPGEILSRDELYERTGAGGGGRAVDVQVTRLRRKIEPDPRLPRYLQTVRGRGYVLRPD